MVSITEPRGGVLEMWWVVTPKRHTFGAYAFISLTVFGASITNLNEPPRALAASIIAWVRS